MSFRFDGLPDSGFVSLTSPADGGVMFDGTFFNVSFAEISNGGANMVFAFLGFLRGDLTVKGQIIPTDINVASGQSVEGACPTTPPLICTVNFSGGAVTLSTLSTVPEPGTLGYLGTGILGIAGLVRKKLTTRL